MPRKRARDPRQMAKEAVQGWFESLLETDLALCHGTIYTVTFDQHFDAIEKALVDEHVREQGEPAAEGDEDFFRSVYARTAGYLIGVQVGLRLRAGGAR